jgi:hypothetical protein
MTRARQLLPEGLANVPPGPELAAVLASLELSRLSGADCVEVLRAQHRQASHEQARLMAAMAEVGRCGIGPDEQLPRMAEPDEFSADEIRGALAWTRRAADSQLSLAWDLIQRLPLVFAALDAGVIDVPKSKVFSEWTHGLTNAQSHAICERLLPEASRLTTGQLIERIKKMAIALDPDWARRRYEAAVRDRKVVGYRNEDGSANLSGYNLPADRAAAACAHIDALAKKIKHAGDRRPIDHVRADLYLAMLDGSYTGWTEQDIITHMLAAARQDTGDPAPGTPHRGQDDAIGIRGRPTPGGEIIKDPGPRHPAPAARRAGVEIRAEVTTLLGLDEHPAEIAGWGFVHAEAARRLVFEQTAAEWRYAITDQDGHLQYEGIVRHRPAGYPPRAKSPSRGGIVELHIKVSDVRRLSRRPARLGGWAAVIAELVRHADRHQRDLRCTDDPREHQTGTLPDGAEAGRRLAKRPDGDPADDKGAGRAGGRNDRRPTAPVRRRTQIRDRTCAHPGCRAPAVGTDGDHTRDWAHGGSTVEGNIASLCRHDHMLKHDGGWRAIQPEPGHLVWISRLGVHYHVRPPLIIEPLPDPIPRGLFPPYGPPAGDDTPVWWEPAESQPAPEPAEPPPPEECETVPF